MSAPDLGPLLTLALAAARAADEKPMYAMRPARKIDRRRVRALVGDGLTDAQIAADLHCSPKTVAQARRELGLPACSLTSVERRTRGLWQGRRAQNSAQPVRWRCHDCGDVRLLAVQDDDGQPVACPHCQQIAPWMREESA